MLCTSTGPDKQINIHRLLFSTIYIIGITHKDTKFDFVAYVCFVYHIAEEHVQTQKSPKRRRTAGVEGMYVIIYFYCKKLSKFNPKQCALFFIMVPGGIVNHCKYILNN